MDADKLFPALVLAALSGISWLAYRHPIAYGRLYWPITGTIWLVFMACLVWDAGTSHGAFAIMPLVPLEKHAEASATREALQIVGLNVLLGYVALSAYLIFLNFLPHLLRENKGDKKGD